MPLPKPAVLAGNLSERERVRLEAVREIVDVSESTLRGTLLYMSIPPMQQIFSVTKTTSIVTPIQSAAVEEKVHHIVVTEELARADAKQVKLPEQHGTNLSRKVRHEYASSYRKIFGVIFTINVAILVALIIEAEGPPDSQAVGSATSANLMVCILFRQEEFVNLVYETFTCVPHSTPLWIRKRLAKVFHYGGCHSGAGTAAVLWYLVYAILTVVDFVKSPQTDLLVNMTTSWVLVLMFSIIMAAAHPSLRRRFHDCFEACHRFAGWMALIAFWIHNIFSARVVARERNTTVGYVLLHLPNFWFICVTSVCTLLSWSRLRQQTAYPEKLSDHATRLHFKYRSMAPFYGIKLSNRPMTEWHAFATIPDIDSTTGRSIGFSVVVSNAGDWTRKQIDSPAERKLWVRGAPLHGLLYTSRLFRRIVIVATGSGIGPCLSLMFADITPRRILWSTKEPEATYGPSIVAAVRKSDPEAVIWNTSKHGYPDIVRETYRLVQESEAEAVFIISNPKVTKKVVFGMQSRRIPAYGAIFDS